MTIYQPLTIPTNPSYKADITLQSVDGVEFAVHKGILILASSFFAKMLGEATKGCKRKFYISCRRKLCSANKPVGDVPEEGTEGKTDEGECQESLSDSDNSEEDKDCTTSSSSDATLTETVIKLTESAEVLQSLLSMIYPGVRRLSLKDEDEYSIILILNAARKYKMEPVIEVLCAKLVDIANSKPYDADRPLALRAYCIASHYKMEAVTRAAARAALRGRGFEKQVPELELITGMEYFLLIQYHRVCTASAIRTMSLVHAKPEFKTFIECKECGEKVNNLAEWWIVYSALASESLRTAPRTAKIFDISFLQRFMKTVLRCKICSENILTRWSSVCSMLEREIEQSIRLVSACLFS